MKIDFSVSSKSADISQLASELTVLPVFLASNSKAASANGPKGRNGKSNRNSNDPIQTLSDRSRYELRRFDSLINGGVAAKLKKVEFTANPGKRVNISFYTSVRDAPKTARKSKSRASVEGQLRVAVMSSEAAGLSESDEWRKLGGDTARQAAAIGAKSISLFMGAAEKNNDHAVRAFFEGYYLAEYRFESFKSRKKSGQSKAVAIRVLDVNDRATAARKAALKRVANLAKITVAGVSLSRDLSNTPPNKMKPKDLVAVARNIARGSRGRISIKVFDKKALERMKAGLLLAVAEGSDAPPYMMHLTFRARSKAKNRDQIVLVGKGVTFDSGGLSIKPGASMMSMKSDMSGAAVCLGLMSTLVEIDRISTINADVHVIVPTTENLLGGSAMRPGDVIRAMNGKTVEVLNTDAEGRLILADALSYAQRISANLVIDIATLTGAVAAALGNLYAGAFSDYDWIIEKITACGDQAGERFWRMPMNKEYRSGIDSSVADIQNIGSPGGGPGATVAALFLKEFVLPSHPWAHLDVAGTSFNGKTNECYSGGATGFGVRTLLRLIEGWSN